MSQEATGRSPATAGPRTVDSALEGRAAGKVPLGDPGAWAVLAFSTTSFMLGLYNAGWVNPLGVTLVIPVAFIFGGVVQLIVAILEVFRGNVFGTAVFGTYGPFWIIYGLIENSFAGKVGAAAGKAAAAGAISSGVTVFLAMFAVRSRPARKRTVCSDGGPPAGATLRCCDRRIRPRWCGPGTDAAPAQA